METTQEIFEANQKDMIHTVQDLIDALEQVKDKSASVRAYFDPEEYQDSEQAEISMISFVDDSMEELKRVDINLFQYPADNG